jgi:hypothetical protein
MCCVITTPSVADLPTPPHTAKRARKVRVLPAVSVPSAVLGVLCEMFRFQVLRLTRCAA